MKFFEAVWIHRVCFIELRRDVAAADSLISNGGFESGTNGWSLFVPDESQDKGCHFDVVNNAPHTGKSCLRMSRRTTPVTAVAFNFIPKAETGRALSRLRMGEGRPGGACAAENAGLCHPPLFTTEVYDADGGHLFIGPGNRVARNMPADPVAKTTLPTTWTQIDAVVEIPPGVDAIGPALFSWWSKGPIYADDFSIEKVDPSTATTPVWQPPAVSAAAASQPLFPRITVTDEDLLVTLNLDAPGMEKVKAAAQPVDGKIDWNAVQSAYLDYRRSACPARWGIMPGDKPAHPTEKDDAAGDQVLQHKIRNVYHFPMAAVVDMGKDFNWTYDPVPRNSPAYSDEWTFGPIGRLEFWHALSSAYWLTGDEKYAVGWVDSLQDFAAKNPMHYDDVPGIPSLWRPLDSAIRISISWPDAYYHFLQSPSFTPEANWLYLKLNYEHALLLLHDLQGTDRHGNWATTECGGLYIIGTLFPEFRDAAAWRQQL